MDALRHFHGTPPVWIFFNVITGSPYLQCIHRRSGPLFWQDTLAFEDPKDPYHIGVVPY